MKWSVTVDSEEVIVEYATVVFTDLVIFENSVRSGNYTLAFTPQESKQRKCASKRKEVTKDMKLERLRG